MIQFDRSEAAGALDAEFAQALAERHERRREAIGVLIGRLSPDDAQDAVDLVFALTSFALFDMMRPGRSKAEVCALVKSACAAALR